MNLDPYLASCGDNCFRFNFLFVFLIGSARMRKDLLGLFQLVFRNGVRGFSEVIGHSSKCVFIYLNRNCLRPFFAFLRYSSMVYGASFSDVTGYEGDREVSLLGNTIAVFYLFYVPGWSCRLCVVGIGPH